MALLDLIGELVGTVPGLSPLLAQKYIQGSWNTIRRKRLWSFLEIDGAVVCPAVVSTGSVNITQYSASVSLNAAASAALAAQTAVSATPGLTNMQIRFGVTTPAAGQIYNIVAFDVVGAPVVLTLDRVVQEATNAAAGYQCYRCYITPPIPDFLSWESIVDVANAIPGLRLNQSSAMFDLRDPQRQSFGLAYFCGRYAGAYIPDPATGAVRPNPNVDAGTHLYELWPHPTQGQNFYVRMRRRGTDFTSMIDTQPEEIPDDLIVDYALFHDVYPFIGANVGNFPSFKGVPLGILIETKRREFMDGLQDAKRNDDEAAMQSVLRRGHGLRGRPSGWKGDADFPIDSNYMQSHLIRM